MKICRFKRPLLIQRLCPNAPAWRAARVAAPFFISPSLKYVHPCLLQMLSVAQSSLAVIIVVVAIATTSFKPDNVRLRNVPPSLQKPSQITDVYSALLARVNKERAANGLPSLCASTKLQKAAQRQSKDMAANDFLHHVGSDGSTVPSRIADAGYKWKSIAENVAGGQADADAVVVTWMNSTGHRMNILGDYTHFGAGYTFNPDGMYTHYWAQEFGTSDIESCDASRPM